mmetsp:Transcript_9402/g.24335  ORF Transcript_9402/g.24335 Transcript_9402/m.24335 type:complete len:310 (+) Transcript_9402:40-969(+)
MLNTTQFDGICNLCWPHLCRLCGYLLIDEGARDKQRQHQCGVSVHLDRLRRGLDLAPRHSLIGLCTRIGTVKLLARVHKDGIVSAIAHQIRIANMVFDEPTTENDHARASRVHCRVVYRADVRRNVEDQPGVLERLKVYHVANRAVSESRAEDGDAVLGSPVVDGVLVCDALAHLCDHLRWCPICPVRFLLCEHLIQHWHHPLLKEAVVAVGHEQVADAVDALTAQLGTAQGKIANVMMCEALHEVFLDPASRGHNHINEAMLCEVAQRLSCAGRDQVGRVAQEDGALGTSPNLGITQLFALVFRHRLV